MRDLYEKYAGALCGKTVAVTGCTGGLGREIGRGVIALGGRLLMLNRDREKSLALKEELIDNFPDAEIENVRVDLSDIDSVKGACESLRERSIDYLVLNAGIYHVPLYTTALGYNNVFTVNFASQYYLARELLPALERTGGKLIAVGSIAHKCAKLDKNDIDRSARGKQMKVYGNSKRFMMYSLAALSRENGRVGFAIAHPGIAATAMTTHYHKAINWIVKPAVKLLFMPPEKAARSIIAALLCDCGDGEWIGPRFLGIRGKPEIKKLRVDPAEQKAMYALAEEIAEKISSHNV